MPAGLLVRFRKESINIYASLRFSPTTIKELGVKVL